jgi:predicted nucleic acid-binding protein
LPTAAFSARKTSQRSTVPILDPDQGDWIFDATVVNNFHIMGRLPLLQQTFTGRAHIGDEVTAELDKGPANGKYRPPSWFTEEPLSLMDYPDFDWLRRRWGSEPNADRGEAASILLAERHHWVFVTDDGLGYHQAVKRKVCATRTPQLLLSLVRSSRLSATDAWTAHLSLVGAKRRLGPPAWNDQAGFTALCGISGFDKC